jgi:hypothetical protein
MADAEIAIGSAALTTTIGVEASPPDDAACAANIARVPVAYQAFLFHRLLLSCACDAQSRLRQANAAPVDVVFSLRAVTSGTALQCRSRAACCTG